MDAWFWDLRHALRGLIRAPGFTLVAVLTLALGIGANTAIFSLLDEVFLRPLPVRAPEETAQLQVITPGIDRPRGHEHIAGRPGEAKEEPCNERSGRR